MTFDIIIGNPPYQEGNRSIYPKFIESAMEICKGSIVFVTKNNWMVGDRLSRTRDKMIAYGIKQIINYPILGELFPNNHVASAIFQLEKGYRGLAQYKTIIHGEMIEDTTTELKIGHPIKIHTGISGDIIDKVLQSKDFEQYSLAKNARLFNIASNGNYMWSDYTESIYSYNNERINNTDIEVIFMDSAHKRYSMYTPNKLIKGQESVGKYKVICGSKAISSKLVLTNVWILAPNQIMTNSYSIVGLADTRDEIEAIYKYCMTKFYRYLVKQAISGDRVTFGTGCTRYIPMINTGKLKEIDWSSTIEEIDNQLFIRFGLSADEISTIENSIEYHQ